MAAEKLDDLWDSWMGRLSSSYAKTLALLQEGQNEQASEEFGDGFCAIVKAVYAECERTYPARFKDIGDWCSWIRDFYSLTAKTQQTLRTGKETESLRDLISIRQHFYMLREKTKGLRPNDHAFAFWQAAQGKNLESSAAAKKLIAIRAALDDFTPVPDAKGDLAKFQDALAKWKAAVDPILKDRKINLAEAKPLRQAAEDLNGACGMRLDPFPPSPPPTEFSLTPKSRVRFATPEEGKRILTTRDAFVERMSTFDRSARIGTDQPVSEEEFLKFAGDNVAAWSQDDMVKLGPALEAVGRSLSRFDLNLPGVVPLIKTTGKEEGRASYTRGDAIVLPARFVARLRPDQLRQVVAHEIFHVLSRRDPKIREALYAMIGFRQCNEVELPENLKSRRITNPDGPRNDHYVQVTWQGKPTAVVPILFSREANYDTARGGPFFDYMEFRLMAVEERKDRDEWAHVVDKGEPVFLKPEQVSGFYEQIGGNAQFVSHPDEILAENFALLVTGKQGAPSPEFLDKMASILPKKNTAATQEASASEQCN